MSFSTRLSLVWVGFWLLAGCTDQRLSVSDAWVRDPVPGSDKSVAYFSLHNRTGEAVTLLGARAENIRAIEMHTTTADADGVLRMRRLSSVFLAPNETVAFAPRGRHLMLFGIESLEAPLSIQLEFDGGVRLMADFQVRGLLDE